MWLWICMILNITWVALLCQAKSNSIVAHTSYYVMLKFRCMTKSYKAPDPCGGAGHNDAMILCHLVVGRDRRCGYIYQGADIFRCATFRLFAIIIREFNNNVYYVQPVPLGIRGLPEARQSCGVISNTGHRSERSPLSHLWHDECFECFIFLRRYYNTVVEMVRKAKHTFVYGKGWKI